MELICHCVSTDCSNCPRYKNWLEGKNPDAKRPQEETGEQEGVSNTNIWHQSNPTRI
ncbi:MAG: hypothetical protein IKA36_06285 [Clostridia bacterium]|nr:hypothetical protein [Clostridia bacterium]